jgi:hypothetical protein
MAGRDFSEVLERIEAKQRRLGDLSDRELSLRAVGKPDLLRDMRRRGGLPRGDRLAEIARVLGTTSDWLLNGGEEGEAEARAAWPAMPVRARSSARASTPSGARLPPRPVPLVRLGGRRPMDEIDEHVELTELHLGEVLDYLARPPSLAGDRTPMRSPWSAIRWRRGSSPASTAFVSPRASVSIGDDVIVQLKGNGEEADG